MIFIFIPKVINRAIIHPHKLVVLIYQFMAQRSLDIRVPMLVLVYYTTATVQQKIFTWCKIKFSRIDKLPQSKILIKRFALSYMYIAVD